MHGNYPRDTEGEGPGAARSHRQGAHVEIWHLTKLRQSGQTSRLVHEELHAEAGDHRSRTFQTGDLLQHRQASLLQELPVESSCPVHQGGSHSGSCDPDVPAIRKDQGGRHREIQ